MKKVFISLSLVSTILFSSCLGSFSAFNNVLDWNKKVTSEKFVNELIYVGLMVLPVYGIVSLGDFIIFNTIEFWTGDNPVAMQEGDKKIKIVKKQGKKLQITTTKNKVNILVLKGENVGNSIDLVFNTQDNSWNYINKEGVVIKLADFKDGIQHVYLPNSKVISLDATTSKEEKIAIINKKVGNYNLTQAYSFVK